MNTHKILHVVEVVGLATLTAGAASLAAVAGGADPGVFFLPDHLGPELATVGAAMWLAARKALAALLDGKGGQ